MGNQYKSTKLCQQQLAKLSSAATSLLRGISNTFIISVQYGQVRSEFGCCFLQSFSLFSVQFVKICQLTSYQLSRPAAEETEACALIIPCTVAVDQTQVTVWLAPKTYPYPIHPHKSKALSLFFLTGFF